MTSPARPLAGLSEIAAGYDLILSDVWGVVHNGIARHRTADDALRQFRAGGGRVVLITNAPRPSAPIIGLLEDMGVAPGSYDSIVSSGDACRALLARWRGRKIHYVGPPVENEGLFHGFDLTFVPAEEADLVVVTDLDSDDDPLEAYASRLALWRQRGLPMICANPDKVVEVGERIVYCGGALADLYEEMGGTVFMAGKPYGPIYEEALRLGTAAAGRDFERSRILAIGDSVRTDAMGAAAFGIDLLFITGSIHAAELDAFGNPDPHAIGALVGQSGVRLAGFMPRLAW